MYGVDCGKMQDKARNGAIIVTLGPEYGPNAGRKVALYAMTYSLVGPAVEYGADDVEYGLRRTEV